MPLPAALRGFFYEGTWGFRPVDRVASDTHGHADWATEEQQRRRFWRVNEVYGCIVVAEIRRRDMETVRGIPFEPDNVSTWGEGGKGDLLVDDARIRSTHILGFAGSGIGKSQSLLCTLAHPLYKWLGTYIVGDPKGELAKKTAKVRQSIGHRVFRLGFGKNSINIFDMLDPGSREFEVDVQALVARMFVEQHAGKADAEGGKWDRWGKQLVCALVAHLMTSPEVHEKDRTPRTLRELISMKEEDLRDVMLYVAHNSPSNYARQQARSITVGAEDTWSGIYANAQDGTSWLSTQAYADMVSERSFHPTELAGGDITVYVQIPPKTLKVTPQLARAIYGTMLEACYAMGSAGKIIGRVFFDVDEAYQLGRMLILETIRDMGRGLGLTMRLWFQSVGQLTALWGPEGKQAWFSSTAYSMFAGISDIETAKEVSAMCGTFTQKVTQEGTSKSRTMRTILDPNSTRGSSETFSEVSRDLVMPSELMQDWADDEVLLFSRGMRPIRAGLPLAFRRKDMRAVLGSANDNVAPQDDEDLTPEEELRLALEAA